jgi:hypothetical protein
MPTIWFERQSLDYFDEHYIYGDYVLVNEIYEDDDHRANTWMWGRMVSGYATEVRLLEGLSSNSYAPWEEVQTHFENMVDNLPESV